MSFDTNDFWVSFQHLNKKSNETITDIKIVANVFAQLRNAYLAFSESLKAIGENFHKEISVSFLENTEKNLTYYHYLGSYLLKIGELNKQFADKIGTEILSPYAEFGHNIKTANYETLEKMKQILLNVDYFKSSMRKSQENYYKIAKSVEKSQENFEKAALKGNKKEEALQKAQDKLIKLKMESSESGEDYKKQISNLNTCLKVLYTDFKSTFEIHEDNEDNKTIYTRNSILAAIKTFNKLYSLQDNRLLEDPEDRFKAMNENDLGKSQITNLMQQGNILSVLKEQPFEEFLSYDVKKKHDDLAVVKMSEADDYAIVYSSGGEKDIQYVMDFCKKFTARDLARRSIGSDSDSMSIGSAASEEGKKQDTEVSEHENEDEDKRLWAILENPANRKFFLETLAKTKEPILNNSEVKLTSKTFDLLVSILVKLLEKLIHDKDYENILLFLPLITKFYTRKDNAEEFLYSSFRKYTVWKEVSLWENLMKVMYEKRQAEEQAKKKSNISNPIVNKLFSFGVKKINNILDNLGKGSQTVTPDREIYLSILHELSFYIGRLTKNLLVSSEILIDLARDVIHDKREIKQLLSIQKDEIDEVLKLRINQVPVNKRKKAEKKWGKHFPVYLALEYLEPKDLIKILQLNKEMRKAFKKRVYRHIFNNYGNTLTKKQRPQIWKNILDINSMNINYLDYLEQFRQVADDKQIHQIEEVINIDVLRSFTNHKELSNQTLLKDLLKSYAMYDKEISYCQGMNYTMGWLYLQLDNANDAFKAFTMIMQLFVRQLFDKDFTSLKKCFFKFTRILELFVPELADHFQEEKVESSFYISAWFITIFTSSLQYTLRPKFIERVWDYFLLDGIKCIFKTGLLIMMHFKDKLLNMKFDQILHFMSEISKDEVFVNDMYWMIIDGKLNKSEDPKNFEFVENYSQNLRKVYITNHLLQLLDIDYEVFEVKLEKYLKPPKKN